MDKSKELKNNIGKIPDFNQSEEIQFPNIMDIIVDGVVINDSEGNIVYINKGFENMLGYPKEEVIGKSWMEFEKKLIKEEERAKAKKAAMDCLKKGLVTNIEVNPTRKDGTKIFIELNFSLMKSLDGRQWLVTIGRDITERKWMEEKEKELAMGRTATETIEAMRDGVGIADLELKIKDVNKACLEMFGYKNKEEMIGKSVVDLVAEEERAVIIERAREEVEKVIPRVSTYTVIDKAGNKFPVQINVSVTKDEKGRPKEFVTVMRDITELRRAERILKANEEHYRVFASYQSVISELRKFYIVEATFEQMIQKTLDLIVEEFGYYMAWYAELIEKEKVILPKLWAGKYEKYLEGLRLEFENDERDAKCAMSMAILTGKPFGYADMEHDKDFEKWRAFALQYGYRSNQAIPLVIDGQCKSAFLIYSTRPFAFSEQIVQCLKGIANELTIIIENITKRKKTGELLNRAYNELEIRVQERTADLVKATETLKDEITERKKAEKTLKESKAALRVQKLELEQKNIALREVIGQIEVEKNMIKDDIINNVNELLLPTLKKVKMKGASKKYINLLQRYLEKLTSSLGRKLTKASFNLSPKETEICNMVEGGLTSKEISDILDVSYQTIQKHRKNIRKKLGLANKDINLASFLQKL